MLRRVFHLLVVGTVFVQLGVVRPCFLDEVVASWFNHAHPRAVACTDPGNVRAPHEDANSPVPEHRPSVSPAREDSVGQMHKFAADVSLLADFELVSFAAVPPVVRLGTADDPPALPTRLGAVTLPLLI